ncbi:hypothetical protein CP985_03480 [Malaciobacter mytili LMG 24559]|uniref:F-type type IV conjugative transfer system protein TraL n=1 Tax=Malaciobacter mytili LMG 24559 TaxID=1032238 RepID=A0AAX2AL74_9BACT|nr:hypothetical protein [Malaciobacter mytili]AXH16420.1 F-type type IV conjugative transfer system protein TraL [Malaciobacter mytili LMG 24559]RXK16486.1 hypothetical protein CP985_03480 [Malaciobacter mytili LMG 24559]
MQKERNFLILLMLLFSITNLFGAVSSPGEVLVTVGIDQAKTTLIPGAVVWILILSGIISALMQKIMPFIIGVICCVVIALVPDLATSFQSFDFKTLSDGTTIQVK